MSISYNKLFILIKERGVKISNLRNDHHINYKVVNRLVHDRSVMINKDKVSKVLDKEHVEEEQKNLKVFSGGRHLHFCIS